MTVTRSGALVVLVVALAGCGGGTSPATSSTRATTSSSAALRSSPVSAVAPSQVAATPPTTDLPVPAALVDPRLDLRSPPLAAPLALEIPSLTVTSPVLAVGITTANVMDAPEGPAQDPVWQEAFWYRGGGIPGQKSTATIAGHVDDSLGRPATFAHLDRLRPGDLVIVRDLRIGLDVKFIVTSAVSYSLEQAASPTVLAQIYGAGPVAGTGPQPSVDGLSHLTLITCAGNFDYQLGTHDHRLVVYATRIA